MRHRVYIHRVIGHVIQAQNEVAVSIVFQLNATCRVIIDHFGK